MVREMDCIPLRNWIKTESQSRPFICSWFGMYAVNNNNIHFLVHVLVTHLNVTETWFFTFYDPVRGIADCGVQFFFSGFFSFEKVDI